MPNIEEMRAEVHTKAIVRLCEMLERGSNPLGLASDAVVALRALPDRSLLDAMPPKLRDVLDNLLVRTEVVIAAELAIKAIEDRNGPKISESR